MNETLARLSGSRQNFRAVQRVVADDKILCLVQHSLFVPAVRIGRGDEKATDERRTGHGYGAYVN